MQHIDPNWINEEVTNKSLKTLEKKIRAAKLIKKHEFFKHFSTSLIRFLPKMYSLLGIHETKHLKDKISVANGRPQQQRMPANFSGTEFKVEANSEENESI